MKDNKIQIFLSWSMELSKDVAELFADWIPNVIQVVDPYYSPVDNDKGKRWNDEIAAKLESSLMGIIFVTQENYNSMWMNFEAGALSNTFENASVCPVLIDSTYTKSNLVKYSSPLTTFMCTEFNKKDMEKLVKSIFNVIPEQTRPKWDVVSKAFETYYDELESEVHRLIDANKKRNKKQIVDKEISNEDIFSTVKDLVVHVMNNGKNIDNTESKIYELSEKFDTKYSHDYALNRLGRNDNLSKFSRNANSDLKIPLSGYKLIQANSIKSIPGFPLTTYRCNICGVVFNYPVSGLCPTCGASSYESTN